MPLKLKTGSGVQATSPKGCMPSAGVKLSQHRVNGVEAGGVEAGGFTSLASKTKKNSSLVIVGSLYENEGFTTPISGPVVTYKQSITGLYMPLGLAKHIGPSINKFSPEELWELIYGTHHRFTEAESQLCYQFVCVLAEVESRERMHPELADTENMMNQDGKDVGILMALDGADQLDIDFKTLPNTQVQMKNIPLHTLARASQQVIPVDPTNLEPGQLSTSKRLVFSCNLDRPTSSKFTDLGTGKTSDGSRIIFAPDKSQTAAVGPASSFVTPKLLHSYSEQLIRNPNFQIRLPATRATPNHQIPEFDKYGRPLSQSGLPLGPKRFIPDDEGD